MDNQNENNEENKEQQEQEKEQQNQEGGKHKKTVKKGGKRKGNEWTKLVTKTYKANHKKDKNYSFKQAIQDARKLYKKGGNNQNQEQQENQENQNNEGQEGGKRKRRTSKKNSKKGKRGGGYNPDPNADVNCPPGRRLNIQTRHDTGKPKDYNCIAE